MFGHSLLSDKVLAGDIQRLIRQNSFAFFKEIVKRAATQSPSVINLADESGEIPLIAAVHSERPEYVQVLLQNGANPNSQDQHGTPALIVAIQLDWLLVVKMLLAAGASANAVNANNVTALLVALQESRSDIYIETLLSAGARVDIANKEGLLPIHIAAAKKQIIHLILLARAGADLNAQRPDGKTILDMARDDKNSIFISFITHYSLQRSRGIIDYTGYELFACDQESRQTVAHIAARLGHQAVMQRLIEVLKRLRLMGILDKRSQYQLGPLQVACRFGHIEVVRLLVANGVNINAKHGSCQAPLHIAAKYDQAAVVKCLAEHDADVNMKYSDRRMQNITAAYLAAQEGNIKVLAMLHSFHADLAVPTSSGDKAADIAALRGHTAVLKMLAEFGVDLAAHGYEGLIRQARKKGHSETEAFLTERMSSSCSSPALAASSSTLPPATALAAPAAAVVAPQPALVKLSLLAAPTPQASAPAVTPAPTKPLPKVRTPMPTTLPPIPPVPSRHAPNKRA